METPRMGLELEMHGVHLSFLKIDAGRATWWPEPPQGVEEHDTMMAAEPVLEPTNPGKGFYKDGRKINWEGEWGLRGVGDNFTDNAFAGQDTPSTSCIIELSTSAVPVADWVYWTASRHAFKAFAYAIEKIGARPKNHAGNPVVVEDGQFIWWPLDDLIAEYNQQIDRLQEHKFLGKEEFNGRFHLKKGQAIEELENGTHQLSVNGEKWVAYVLCPKEIGIKMDAWCDVQVNYELGLKSLYDNTTEWLKVWDGLWLQQGVSGMPDRELDPAVGDVKGPIAPHDVANVQIYAAMWRVARVSVDDILRNLDVAPEDCVLVKALLMYILVASSVSLPEVARTQVKNQYAQLPKTSPASIVDRVMKMSEGKPESYRKKLSDCFRALHARDDAFDLFRSIRKETTREGAGNLYEGKLPFITYEINDPRKVTYAELGKGQMGILNNNGLVHSQAIWRGAFARTELSDKNDFGFTSEDPFYLPWATDYNTSYPAQRAEWASHDVKMMFESRIGRNKLNLGFNPYIEDFMFRRSYLSMVKLLAPEHSQEIEKQVHLLIEDDGKKQRNLKFVH